VDAAPLLTIPFHSCWSLKIGSGADHDFRLWPEADMGVVGD